MIDFISELEREHEDIEIELKELEFIMNNEDGINYSNIHHTFSNLCRIWNAHEEKEEKIFPVMKKEQITVPVETMLCEHKDLKSHKQAIDKAIASGSQIEMKNALENHLMVLIHKFRKHMEDEENVLYAITIEVFTPEELEEIEKSIV